MLTAAHLEIILQRAVEYQPEARPQIISDNGPRLDTRATFVALLLREQMCYQNRIDGQNENLPTGA